MTDDELRAYAAEHLMYEVWMAGETAIVLIRRQSPATEEDEVIRNALLESHLVHVRNLKEFLFDQRKWPDDVTADDYVADRQAWQAARGPAPEELRVAERRIGKGMAHLTTGRVVDPAEKAWRPQELLRALAPALARFEGMTPPERLGPETRSAIRGFVTQFGPERRP